MTKQHADPWGQSWALIGAGMPPGQFRICAPQVSSTCAPSAHKPPAALHRDDAGGGVEEEDPHPSKLAANAPRSQRMPQRSFHPAERHSRDAFIAQKSRTASVKRPDFAKRRYFVHEDLRARQQPPHFAARAAAVGSACVLPCAPRALWLTPTGAVAAMRLRAYRTPAQRARDYLL
jgi:hypothetical protein